VPPPREPTAEEKARHLPELTVDYVGLHVGGGPNDAAGKQPFERVLAARFEEFRRCYRVVEVPGSGGTFGVDLFIGRDGGHPSVRQVRTRIKGDAFTACMVSAFEGASFDKPRKGPTLVSYSVSFSFPGLKSSL
jgi:hypothetical protein